MPARSSRKASSKRRNSTSQFNLIETDELDEFLKFLFAEIARKPAPLGLREVSSIVRYLMSLGVAGIPRAVLAQGAEAIKRYSHDRRSASENRMAESTWQMAEIIWRTLIRSGNIPLASKKETEDFLRAHAKTYLANPYLSDTLRFVRKFELSDHTALTFTQPHLMSRHINAQGQGNPYLLDDLTERIAAAYFALTRVGIRDAYARIAKALCEVGHGGRVNPAICIAAAQSPRLRFRSDYRNSVGRS